MNDLLKTEIKRLAQAHEFFAPQEKLVMVQEKTGNLFIGIPKENLIQENRIPLRPEAVRQLVNNGHEVWVESGAGKGAKHSDRDYSESGAKIVYSPHEVFSADIIIKIEPPTCEQINMMKTRSAIISALQLAKLSPEILKTINQKRITALAFELLEDRSGALPFVRAMSEIAGNAVVSIAAEYLSSVNDGNGVILGGLTGVPPTSVVILGAGTVAEYAARAALGLGASVQIFDKHLYRLHRLKQNVGYPHIYTAPFEPFLLRKALSRADVVVGALRAENGRTPCIVSEDMIQEMQPNSVIIDVSIDGGGCFATSEMTTHQRPTYKKYDIIHYCVPNIPSRVARTASTAISNIFSPLLLEIAEKGGVEELIFSDRHFAKGVYSHSGEITSHVIAQKFNMKYKDLMLLVAPRF